MTLIQMTFTLSKNPRELSIPRSTARSTLKQKIQQVQKVTHVYQLKYKNGNIYGFGDFIRGCFYLLQICNKIGIQFDVDVSNHPISNYIEGHVRNPCIQYDEIYKHENLPHILFDALKNTNSKNYCLCTNAFPLFNIKQEEIEFIKHRLQPTPAMKTDIEQEMTTLHLSSKQFSVIHIRSGDEFLLKSGGGGEKSKKWIDIMFSLLTPILQDKTTKYLILSDNNQLKLLFRKYDNCIVQFKPITHLGIGKITDANVKNTMMDFYLMSHSNQIFSISTYGHGTGFSKWCSVLNNIPYKIIQIKQIVKHFKLL